MSEDATPDRKWSPCQSAVHRRENFHGTIVPQQPKSPPIALKERPCSKTGRKKPLPTLGDGLGWNLRKWQNAAGVHRQERENQRSRLPK